MKIPNNVFWFEVLLYLSLVLDAVSAAFQDRTPTAEATESVIATFTVITICMILLLVYFVWLAAHHRKNWPRWVLLAALVLSVFTLVQELGESGLQVAARNCGICGISLSHGTHPSVVGVRAKGSGNLPSARFVITRLPKKDKLNGRHRSEEVCRPGTRRSACVGQDDRQHRRPA